MDDIVSGAPDLETAQQLQSELKDALQSCGMNLHKWSSNSPELLNSSLSSDVEHSFSTDIDLSVKTWGVSWKPFEDYFVFKQLWQCKLDWDDVLHNSIVNEWREFVTTLKCIEEAKNNRFIMADNNVRIVLQGFADASEAAYGVVVYLQCFLHNSAAKLCACVLLAQLIKKIHSTLRLNISDIVLHTDSTITLSWLNTPANRLKTFVANRVAKVQELTEGFQWNHVPLVLNPADLVSRGLRPCDLPNLRLWWHGPQFLEKDSDGLLRVGGRLSNSDLPYVNKHPAILPGNHNLTVQIIVHFHRKNLHTGGSSLLHYVREKFWPLNGRSSCRKVVHECLVCFKSRPLVTSQLMGNLPHDRVVPDYPFNCSAIHIEIVSDLRSDAFIAILKRFFSRRGKCAKLYSDNGKTFVGANKELKRFLKLIEDSDDNLAGFLSAEGIEWKFIPPRAPSFGGLWEASVKSIKIPLRRNRRQYEQLTDFDRGRIIGLREAGWSNRRIGRHLGRSDMVVARCWQQWITEGRVYRRGGSGRPRNTNDREDRAIRRVTTSAPTTSLASIQLHLPPSRHPVPSRETIRRRLTEVGLRSRRPLRRLPLTPHHRQCRLDFADLGQLGV
ncbi:integrase catalytic domain-containing protein [Trichonephila clavipes]|nr:integrase catalytic domain-containing protein [Trichonephila clavipes]